jgi:hypothetical protein
MVSRFKKKTLFILFFLFILGIALPYLIPKSLVEMIVSRSVKGTFRIEKMHLAPFGTQYFEEVRIESDEINASIEKIRIDAGIYWALIFFRFTDLYIFELKGALLKKIEGVNGEKKGSYNESYTPRVHLVNGSIEYNGANFSPIDGFIQYKKKSFEANLKSRCEFEKLKGEFSLDTKLEFDSDWSDEIGQILQFSNNIRGYLFFTSKKFPLLWSKTASSLLGESISAKIQTQFEPSLVASVEIESPLLNLNAACNFDSEGFSFTRASMFNYTFTNGLVELFDLDFSILNPSSIAAAIRSNEDWSISLQNPLKLKTKEGETLGFQSFYLDRKFKNYTLDSLLIQPQKKGSLSIKTLRNAIQFQCINVSTSWGQLVKNGSYLLQLGPTVSLNGSLEEPILNLSIQAEKLELPSLRVKIEGSDLTLLEEASLSSAWGGYKIKSFLKEKGAIAFSVEGGQSPFDFSKDGYKTKFFIQNIALNKQLHSATTGYFDVDFSAVEGPYTEQLFKEGNFKGNFEGSFEELKISTFYLKAPNGSFQSAWKFEDRFEEVTSLRESQFFLATPQGVALSGVIPSFSWEKDKGGELSCHADILKSSLQDPKIEILGGNIRLDLKNRSDLTKIEYKTFFDFNDAQGKKGFIDSKGKFQIQNNLLSYLDVEGEGKHLPVKFFDPLFADFVGESIDLKFKSKGRQVADTEILAENPQVKVKLYGTYSKEAFSVSKNKQTSFIELKTGYWTKLPFLKDHSIGVRGGGNLKLVIDSFFYPHDVDLKKLEFVGVLSAKKISFVNQKTEIEGEINECTVAIDKRPFGPFNGQLSASTSVRQANGSPITGNSNLSLIYNPSQENTISLYLKFDQFPVLDTLFFGSTLNGTAFIDATQGLGKAALHLESQTFQIDADANIEKNILFLSAPVKGRIRNIQSENVSLQKGNWVPFYIPSKDVRVPLFPLKIENLQLPRVVVAPFVVSTKVEGNTKSVLSALSLGYQGSVLVYCVPVCGENQKIGMEQRPASLSVVQGVLYVPRIDLLVGNKVWIVMWGSMDLKTNQTTIYIGLTGQTLRQALGIEQLSPSFVLPIRTSGNLNSIKIQKQDIVTAIAFLTAKIYSQRVAPKGNEINLDFLVDQRSVPPMTCPPSWSEN